MVDPIRRWLGRFGRPAYPDAPPRIARDLTALDVRITDMEREQRGIANRLRLLELQGDPRGLGVPRGC